MCVWGQGWALAPTVEMLADPTRPPSLGAQVQAEPVRVKPPAAIVASELRAVRIANNGRLAVIEGREVRVGDRIGDARVTQIGEDRVILRDHDGSTRTLYLFAGIEKQFPLPTRGPRASRAPHDAVEQRKPEGRLDP
jgi:MSHA biogenesis protein MshK